MNYYTKEYEKFLKTYTSKKYHLGIIGNTLYIIRNKNIFRKEKVVDWVCMAFPNYSSNITEWYLHKYGFQEIEVE